MSQGKKRRINTNIEFMGQGQGDPVVATNANTMASVPTNLNVGSGPLLQIANTSGDIDLYNSLTLSETLQNIQKQTYYPTTGDSQAGTGVTALTSFNVTHFGWAYTDKIYLEIPLKVTVKVPKLATPSTGKPFSQVDPLLYLDYDTCWRNGKTNGVAEETIRLVNPLITTEINQPDFAFLGAFKNFDLTLRGGIKPNNNSAFTTSSIKQAFRDSNLNELDILELSQWGLPVSHLVDTYNNTPSYTNKITDGTSNFIFPSQNTTLDPKWFEGQRRVIESLSGFNGATYTAGTPQTGDTYTKTIWLPFKLKRIMHMLRNTKLIFPGFQYRLDIEYYTSAQPVMFSTGDNGLNPIVTVQVASGSQMRIHCLEGRLSYPVQQLMNEKWTSMPLNIIGVNTSYFDVTAKGGELEQRVTISYAQNQPFLIKVGARCSVDDFTNNKVKDSLFPLALKSGVGDMTAVKIKKLSVEENGITSVIYDYNYLDDPKRKYVTALDLMNIGQNEDIFNEWDKNNAIPAHLNSFNSQNCGCEIPIVINPDQFASSIHQSLNQGAKFITVVIETDVPIPANISLRITKYDRSSFRINTNQEITSVVWPALPSGNTAIVGNVAPAGTAN